MPDESHPLKREALHGPLQSTLTYCPARGGIVTSLKLHGMELLYLDETTFNDPTKNVRGGIPQLFPNAGPIEDERFPGLKSHGFARLSSGWTTTRDVSGRSFYETLIANEDARQVYPYECEYTFQGQFELDGSVTFTQRVKNLESVRLLPISFGLHPYFKVPHALKDQIRFDFPGGNEIEAQVADWSQDKTLSLANPHLKHPEKDLRVVIPQLGTLILNASAEYQRFWIWSLPERDFVCIEPVMRDVGGLIANPKWLKPHETFSAHLTIRLEK
jgi:galactose mutarotase-like enzyme